jgi:hypothetical protein
MKFSIQSVIVFLGLAIGFYFLSGGPNALPSYPFLNGLNDEDPVQHCFLMYLIGAGVACFGDGHLGRFELIPLRGLYITIGTLIMATMAAWMYIMHLAVKASV